MRLRLSRHLRHLTPMIALLGAVAVVGTIGVLAGTTALPLGAATACGCAAAGNPNFSVSASPLNPMGSTVVHFTIKNISGHAAKVKLIKFFPRSHPQFEQNETEVLNCETTYAVNGTCPFTVQYVGTAIESLEAEVEDENSNLAGSGSVSGLK